MPGWLLKILVVLKFFGWFYLTGGELLETNPATKSKSKPKKRITLYRPVTVQKISQALHTKVQAVLSICKVIGFHPVTSEEIPDRRVHQIGDQFNVAFDIKDDGRGGVRSKVKPGPPTPQYLSGRKTKPKRRLS